MPTVRVELYGLARHRAGIAAITVTGTTVGQALAAVDQAYPTVQLLREGRVSPEYLVSVRGGRFTTDLSEALNEGDALVLLGADAGG